MADKKTNPKRTDKTGIAPKTLDFVFGRENYILMAIGIVVIAIGFTLMSGKEDIFNDTKLTVAPVIVVIGFIIEAFAVMYKSKD